MKKLAKNASSALCAVAVVMLALVLLMTAVQLTGLNKNYFMKSHDRLETAQKIGVSQTDLEMITEAVVDYLKGDREDLDLQADIALRGNDREVFTETEKLHMVDVYWMFRTGFIARDWCALIFAVSLAGAYFLKKEGFAVRCAKTALITCGALILILAVAAILIGRDFTDAFFLFHELTFVNDLWLLSYEEHVLVNLVPMQYFSTIARDIALIFAAGIVAVCVACTLVLFKGGKKGSSDAV